MLPRRALALLLSAVLILAPGCATSLRRPDGLRPVAEKKSAALGVLIAIFPGFFVHGLGHLYAGDTKTFKDLLKEEGYGLLLLAAGIGVGLLAIDSDQRARDSEGGSRLFHRSSSVISGLLAGLGIVFGAVFFFDSWIRDIIGTPDAIEDVYYGTLDDDQAFEEALEDGPEER